jgi:hypothetical protein
MDGGLGLCEGLAGSRGIGDICSVRMNKTSVIVLSVLVFTASHTTGSLPDSSSTNLQAAEAKAQETVNLAVSGMT